MSVKRYQYPKSLRLTARDDFRRLQRRAKRWVASHFIIFSYPNKLPSPRLGMWLSKKYIRTAVARNQIKRVIRESFRYRQQELQGLDIIVQAQKGADQLTNSEMRQQLDQQWEKLITFYHKPSA